MENYYFIYQFPVKITVSTLWKYIVLISNLNYCINFMENYYVNFHVKIIALSLSNYMFQLYGKLLYQLLVKIIALSLSKLYVSTLWKLLLF
jgi:hypothetical protein